MFRNLTIGKKIAYGFGLVLILLVVVGTLSFRGVSGMNNGAKDVIAKNELIANLTSKEVDHLNWASAVSELLTNDEVTELNVQTDDHKCAFGEWLFSDARIEAERDIPELAPILKEVEGYHADLHTSAIDIKKHFTQANADLPGILAARTIDHLYWAEKIRDCFLTNCDAVNVELDPTQCALGKWLTTDEAREAYKNSTPDFRQAWDKMVVSHRKLHESAEDISTEYAQVHEGLKDLLLNRLLDHKNWAEKVSEAIIEGNSEIGVQTDHAKCSYGKFIVSQECVNTMKGFPALREAVEASKEPHQDLHESAIDISRALGKGVEGKAEAEQIFKEKTLVALGSVGECFHQAIEAESKLYQSQLAAKELFVEKTQPLLCETVDQIEIMSHSAENALAGMRQANQIFATQTKPNLEKTQELLGEACDRVAHIVEQANKDMLSLASSTKGTVSIMSIAAIVLGVVIAFLIVRGIVSALKIIISNLSEGADQVAGASGEVSTASQSLAEGATEQAAGLEETSSSLEEMSSMTKQTADNAQQANVLSNEAKKAADNGTSAMEKMSGAINDIQKSSNETAKIIKVVDEIAFQTNLLALNAAVEAARAGEAGKGFAVVAEEVRNLAMRSAEAAKDTSGMIEESVSNSKNGVDIAEEVGKVLGEIVNGVSKTSDLIGEIAAASQEQAQGIDQVTTAVNQMDKVTQQNAANAEESASASEELNAQAEQMNLIANELSVMVGGLGGKNGHTAMTTTSQQARNNGLSRSNHVFHQIANNATGVGNDTVESTAKKTIPLDSSDDLNSFND